MIARVGRLLGMACVVMAASGQQLTAANAPKKVAGNGFDISVASSAERAACVIHTAQGPHVILYAQGALTLQLQQAESDESIIWSGDIAHCTQSDKTRTYDFQFSTSAPHLLSFNGQTVAIARKSGDAEDLRDKCECFVITATGKIVSTHRYFAEPAADDLDPARQFSTAYYLDAEIYEAETHSETLAMNSIPGAVIAWDRQNCISHSDSARTARLRIYPDGRVLRSAGYRQSIQESWIPVASVKQLALRLYALGTDPQMTKLQDGAELEIGVGALWDQHQEVISVRHAGKCRLIHVIYPGRKQPMGQVPLNWDEIQALIAETIAPSPATTAE